MPNIRPLNKEKYEVSKHRFQEIYHHCMQYKEWKDELRYCEDTVKSIGAMNEGRASGGTGSATEQLAIKRIKLREKCELIEQTAIEADAEIYPYILKGVTEEFASCKYLKEVCGMPCGKDMYYDRRRKFYWLMSKKI